MGWCHPSLAHHISLHTVQQQDSAAVEPSLGFHKDDRRDVRKLVKMGVPERTAIDPCTRLADDRISPAVNVAG